MNSDNKPGHPSDQNKTLDNTAKAASDSKAKKIKKQGPIRFEAVIPVAVIFALIYFYFALFFDSHLKAGLELGGTYANGAEVNIEKIESSFWGGYFRLHGLQVTDKAQPSQNILQIQQMNFELIWDALLRAKFVVKEASIDNIMTGAPRKKPGRVLPPPPPSKDGKSQALQQIEDKFIEHSKEQFNQNVLGDVVGILDGTDPSEMLKQIQTSLKAEAKIKELETALNEKKKVWDERLKNLPQKPQIDALVAKTKTLKFNTKDPKQFAADLKELDKIIKEGDAIVKEFNSASSSLKGDVQGVNSDFKNLDELIKQDIKDLESRLKIPKIDVADFSKGLFGKMVSENLAKYKKYIDLGRQYMPPPKDKSKETTKVEIRPKERSEGQDFSFPKAKAYPTFWLQLARITSKENQSEYSGNLGGEITHLTSQPRVIGKPLTIDIKGNFPKQQINGLQATVVVDHTTDDAFEKFDIAIQEYPITKGFTLSDSKDVKFAVTNAKGQLDVTGVSRDGDLNFNLQNKFQNVGYDISAKSKIVQEILTNVTQGIPMVDLNAKVTGPWNKLSWSIRSNLGDELSNGFKQQLQAKIDEAKKKLDAFIQERIGAEKAKLTQQYEQIKGQFDKQIEGKKKELEGAKKQAEAEMNKKKGGSKDQLKSEAKKAEQKLKKLFGK